MINIGIIGFGNISLNVHLPILLSRNDVKIVWIVDKDRKFQTLFKKKKIDFYSNIQDAINSDIPEIALISVPYGQRKEIFNVLKGKVSGIYCEKPLALSTNEHLSYVNGLDDFSFTIGYQRRSLGNVQTVKSIIESNIFGTLQKIEIEFGSINFNFGGYRSQKLLSGGGIFLEVGSHWIDTALYVSNAKEISEFQANVEYEDGLDINSYGKFKIKNSANNTILFNFKFSCIENTKNYIKFIFPNICLSLNLFEDNSEIIITSNTNLQKFFIHNFLNDKFPNDSLSQASVYWDEFLKSFKEKKRTYTNQDTFLLTTKIIELFYAN
jgi:predicted dehydrogenase